MSTKTEAKRNARNARNATPNNAPIFDRAAAGIPSFKDAVIAELRGEAAQGQLCVTTLKAFALDGVQKLDDMPEEFRALAGAKQRLSAYNTAGRAHAVFGDMAALALVNDFANANPSGRVFVRVVDALRSALNKATELAGKDKAVTASQAREAKQAGLNAVQVSEHKRQPRTPDKSASKSATAQAAVQVNDWASVAGFALMLSQIAHKLTDVEGHESQCKDARDALAEAAEVLAPFIPKTKKSVVKA